MQIITFDFHNTIAHCDPWFDLEIRDLPATVLRELHGSRGVRAPEELQADATAAYRALRRDVMASGVEVDAQEGVERVFAMLDIDAPSAAIAAAIERAMREAFDSLSPVPGSVETIDAILADGIPVGVISSAVYHPFLEWALEAFALRDRLAFIATSASIGYYKSDTRIYHDAYRLASADPGLGVHVGDSPRWDVAVAQEAGIAAALYAAPDASREVPVGIQPDLVLSTLVGADAPLRELLRERETGRVRT